MVADTGTRARLVRNELVPAPSSRVHSAHASEIAPRSRESSARPHAFRHEARREAEAAARSRMRTPYAPLGHWREPFLAYQASHW